MPATAVECPPSPAHVAALNRTHAMAGLRERGGGVVRAIEERRRRLVASRVLRSRPSIVVDVGCEDGWIAEAYARDVPGETVLVDLDPAMLRRAALKGLPRTRTLVADACDRDALSRALPRVADVAVLSAILEHVADPVAALCAAAATLRPGGRIVAFVPADGPIVLAKRLLRTTRLLALVPGVSPDPAPGHVRRFDRASFARLLRRVGDVEEVGFDPAVLGYIGVVRVGVDRVGVASSARSENP